MKKTEQMKKPTAAKSAAKKPSKLAIYIQSPYGGEITPEEVWDRMLDGTEACYVRFTRS